MWRGFGSEQHRVPRSAEDQAPDLSRLPTDPLTVVGPSRAWEPLLSPSRPRRATNPVWPPLFLSPLPLPPSHALRTHTAGGASEGRGSGLGPQQTPRSPSGQGKCWLCSLRSPKGLSPIPDAPLTMRGPLQAWELPQPPLRGTGPNLPPPLPMLPPHPHILPSCSGVLSISLGVHGPPPVPGRCPSCEETQTPLPPTPPS